MAEETKDSPAPGTPGGTPVAPARENAPDASTTAPALAGGTNAPQVSTPAAPPKPATPSAPVAVATAAAATGTTPTPAAAKPAPPVAAKPAAPAARPATPAASADGLSRRGFFSWAAVAWVGFTAAIGGCVTTMGRFMFPNVLFEPPTMFKANKPEDYPAGVVDTRLVDEHGVWIVHDGGKIFALIAICTHLGCPPAWLAAQNKFKCPCHGSGYDRTGVNFEGPTPRPLERAKIFVSGSWDSGTTRARSSRVDGSTLRFRRDSTRRLT
jgi:cytochrome b6-f complex iron-sulfur subunit